MDGKKSHASRLTKSQVLLAYETLTSLSQDGHTDVPVSDSDRPYIKNTRTTPARIRQSPCWFRDYVAQVCDYTHLTTPSDIT